MYAHIHALMSPKRAKNLTLSERLLKIAESYCARSDRKFAPYVEELVRADLLAKGYPVDAAVDEVMKYVAEQKAAHRKKRK